MIEFKIEILSKKILTNRLAHYSIIQKQTEIKKAEEK